MDNIRLAKNIRPYKYFIRIDLTGPDENHFHGSCTIVYYGASTTNQIVLNSLNLNIGTVYLCDSNCSYQHQQTVYDTDKQQVSLIFSTVPSEGIITIDYIGNVYDRPHGLCKIVKGKNITFYTQFEPIHARKCFPCFDEPIFKAIFSLTLVMPKLRETVISNTSTKQIIHDKEKITYIFHDTPPMSTYLVAFYVGNMEKSEGKTLDGITIRVFSKKPKMYREYVLMNMVSVMDKLVKLFDYTYPVNKLDLVYVPLLDGQAMENWGIITVRDDEDKYDDNTPLILPLLSKIDIVRTIVHELVHQWIGNNVSIDWWGNVWLKEGITTWFTWYVINDIYPEWKPYEYLYIHDIVPIFQLDSTTSVPSVVEDITKIDQISEIFNLITYYKGAAIITMLVDYIGFDDFIKAVRAYIKKYQYANANTENFINTIQSFTKKPIIIFMKKWLKQKNYPLANVSLVDAYTLLISQEKYTVGKNPDSDTWIIPLTKNILLEEKSKMYDNIFAKINKNGSGYYIVNDDPMILENILEKHFSNLSILDIAQILNDLFMTLRASKLSYPDYLKFLGTILSNLQRPLGLITELIDVQYDYFTKTVTTEDVISRLVATMEPYVINAMNRLGTAFSGQDDIDTINSRIHAFHLACRFGIKKYLQFCEEMIIEWMNSYQKGYIGKIMDPYLENTIIRTGIRHPDNNFRNKIFNFLMELHKHGSETKLVLNNIVFTPDNENYQRALGIIMNDGINYEEKNELLEDAGKNEKLNKYFWVFFKENWGYIKHIFTDEKISYLRFAEIFGTIVDIDGSIRKDMQSVFADVSNLAVEKITANTFFHKLLA